MVLFFRFRWKAVYLIFSQLGILIIILFVIEAFGQVYTSFYPGFRVLQKFPDSVLGWKQVPNFKYTYTGNHWFAREFNPRVEINAEGFRDIDHEIKKKPDVIRIALLGNSMVEALQVSREETGGFLLEQKLNRNLTKKVGKQFEVLNFGVGSYGMGQSLLAYEQYARKYSPDYIFLFTFDWHIWRTINQKRCSRTKSNQKLCLRVRPAFDMQLIKLKSLSRFLHFKEFDELIIKLKREDIRGNARFPFSWEEYQKIILKQGSRITPEIIHFLKQEIKDTSLVLHKVRDYEKFIKAQEKLLEKEFNGFRVKQYKRKLYLMSLWHQIQKLGLKRTQKKDLLEKERRQLLQVYAPENPDNPKSQNPNFPDFKQTILVNLKVLEILKQLAEPGGAKLILVDGTIHFVHHGKLPAVMLSKIFREFAKELGIGYIPLGEHLNEANRKGIATRWRYDGHFNKNGNRIFAESIYHYLNNAKTNN